MAHQEDTIRRLAFWSGSVEIEPAKGGITNANFRVTDGKNRYFVRTGSDITVHGIMRFSELQASLAAASLGISPKIVYHEPGLLVFDYIEAKTLTPEDVREPDNLRRISDLIKICHREMKHHLRGPAMMFWVFHVIRDYAHSLKEIRHRLLQQLPYLLEAAEILERTIGPVDIVYSHNDLLSANFLDDGKRLWLVDWDYAGFNSPLFDLANLCSNNDISGEAERDFLAGYFGYALDGSTYRRYHAMKVASLLRETMWSMISEHYSTLDFDYENYTQDYLTRFIKAYETFNEQI